MGSLEFDLEPSHFNAGHVSSYSTSTTRRPLPHICSSRMPFIGATCAYARSPRSGGEILRSLLFHRKTGKRNRPDGTRGNPLYTFGAISKHRYNRQREQAIDAGMFQHDGVLIHYCCSHYSRNYRGDDFGIKVSRSRLIRD